MVTAAPKRMTPAECLEWDDGTDTHHELVRGQIVAMAPPASPAEVNEQVGGEDAGEGLVIHYGPDGLPHAHEAEHASKRPASVARALGALHAAKSAYHNRLEFSREPL